MRNFAKALEHGRRSVDIAPKDVINRANLAVSGMYAGDFATAADEDARRAEPGCDRVSIVLPACPGGGIAEEDFDAARGTYDDMSKSGTARLVTCHSWTFRNLAL